jgi:NADPH-dependent 2,4-dienoyl-CoA reductase/sulfur reductase-like enzyme
MPEPSARLRCVVVGASLAGVRAAEAIRRAGFDGRLTLIGAETVFPPVDRPPLSKQVLLGAWEPARAALRVAVDLDAELLLGRSAASLALADRQVVLDDGQAVAFDGLLVATGSVVRRLPELESGQSRVHYLRTVDDCLALRDRLREAKTIVIVGAGLIGLEVAAAARTLGVSVDVVDVLPAPMERVAGPTVGHLIRRLHESHGVRFHLGTSLVAVDAAGATLGDGSVLPADIILVAAGARPATDWLAGTGLDIRDGIACDEFGRVLGAESVYADSVYAESVYAAGDVAATRNLLYGRPLRVEHWTNAAAQAEVAGMNLGRQLLGSRQAQPHQAIPYYWTDQYDWKLQMVGLVGPDVAAESDADGRRRAFRYSASGVLTGVLCVNWPSRLRLAKQELTQSLHAQRDRRAEAVSA